MACKCPGTVVQQRFPGTLLVPHFRFQQLLQHAFQKSFAKDEIAAGGLEMLHMHP